MPNHELKEAEQTQKAPKDGTDDTQDHEGGDLACGRPLEAGQPKGSCGCEDKATTQPNPLYLMIQDVEDGEAVDSNSEGPEEKVDDCHVSDGSTPVSLLWGRPLVVDDKIDSIFGVSGPWLVDNGPTNKVLHPGSVPHCLPAFSNPAGPTTAAAAAVTLSARKAHCPRDQTAGST